MNAVLSSETALTPRIDTVEFIASKPDSTCHWEASALHRIPAKVLQALSLSWAHSFNQLWCSTMSSENQKHIAQLEERVKKLHKRQSYLKRELDDIQEDLNELLSSESSHVDAPQVHTGDVDSTEGTPRTEETPKKTFSPSVEGTSTTWLPSQKPGSPKRKRKEPSTPSYSGQQIASVLGVVVMLIGVTIGVKYVIDNNLISPAMRIVLGYLLGAGFISAAKKVRDTMPQLSASLFSGAMATWFIVTYTAHTLYGLLPVVPTFLLMFVFTALTVVSSLAYNKQVIAFLGLVGSYLIPFLLSSGQGQYEVLFSYLIVLNIGTTAIALKAKWVNLNRASFYATWIIVFSWVMARMQPDSEMLVLMFVVAFFCVFLARGIIVIRKHPDTYTHFDAVEALSNTTLTLMLGTMLLSDMEFSDESIGAFTGAFAVLYAVLSTRIPVMADNKTKLYQALSMACAAITMPIWFSDNVLAVSWIAQAIVLVYISPNLKNWFVRGGLAVLLSGSTFLIVDSWYMLTKSTTVEQFLYSLSLPFVLNEVLVTGLIVAPMLFVLTRMIANDNRSSLIPYATVAGFLLCLGLVQNVAFWKFEQMGLIAAWGTSIDILYHHFSAMKLLSGLLFVATYGIAIKALHRRLFVQEDNDKQRHINLYILKVVACVNFVMVGIACMVLAAPEVHFASDWVGTFDYSTRGFFRMLLLALYGTLVYALYALRNKVRSHDTSTSIDRKLLTGLTSSALFIVLTSEFVRFDYLLPDSLNERLVMTIIWGVFALTLITFGLKKENSIARLSGIVVLGVALFKTVLVDLSHMSTIAKTIVFLGEGAFILIGTYFYNRYLPESDEGEEVEDDDGDDGDAGDVDSD